MAGISGMEPAICSSSFAIRLSSMVDCSMIRAESAITSDSEGRSFDVGFMQSGIVVANFSPHHCLLLIPASAASQRREPARPVPTAR